MPGRRKPLRLMLVIIFIPWCIACNAQGSAQPVPSPSVGAAVDFPTVLYGAAYYNEYMPGDSGCPAGQGRGSHEGRRP